MTDTPDKKQSWERRPFPRHSLEQALVLAKAIQDQNAGNPMNRLLLAGAVGLKPTSSEYRDLLSSSYKYGLTFGTEKAENIILTDLGKNITRPISDEQKTDAIKQAILIPELFKKIYNHYNSGKFPSGQFFENALETNFKIPREYAKEASLLLEKNGRFAGVIKDISGSAYVMLASTTIVPENVSAVKSAEAGAPIPPTADVASLPDLRGEQYEKLKPIFIAHGKNKKSLDQLKNILEQFKIPHKIAIDEAHSGRPISQKVRTLMQECGSAIFIFSKEGELKDEQQGSVPNSNVVFELGAASVLYGDKVIIFKEEGLKLPSDFSDLGYIEFNDSGISAKAFELMKELVVLGFVKFVPT